MVTWSIAALLALVALLALLALYRARRRRSERLQLRLLAGRSHLLGEEIAQRLEELEELERRDQESRAAEEALNHLHLLLVERQAHLQNCEDLVHLQERKLSHLAEAPPSPPARERPAAVPPSPAQRRSQAEEELLRQIEALNKQRRQPPPKK